MKNLDLLLPQAGITQTQIWATVTQASPLRIQLDGEPGPLPLTPGTLVSGLQVGDRVRVELTTNNDPRFYGRSVVVLGKAGGFTIPLEMPAGVYVPFAGSSVPTGWLLCDGAAVSRTTYAALFAAIGTTYGAGNGSTTFNVPDMRGRVPVGRDTGQSEFNVLGETGGEKRHTLTAQELPNHVHGWAGNINATASTTADTPARGSGGADPGFRGQAELYETETYGSDAITGDRSHNNLQPYRVANYIIKT